MTALPGFSTARDDHSLPDRPAKPVHLTETATTGASELRTVKCYRCHHYDVVAVCHHCGRFVCRRCRRVSPGRFWGDRVFSRFKPALGDKLSQAAHCPACFHLDWPWGVILSVGAGGGGLVLLTAWDTLDSGRRLGLLAAIITLGLLSWLVERWRGRPDYPLGLPLFTKVKVEIEECIQADMAVNDGPYLTSPPAGQGFIQTTVDLTPNDLARVEQMSAAISPITFYSGFVGLENLKNIQFVRRSGLRCQPNLLRLAKTMAYDEFARLCCTSTPTTLIERYDIQPEALQVGPPHNRDFPLLIKPRRRDSGYRLEILFEIPVDFKLKFAKTTLKKARSEPGLEGKPILDSLNLVIPIGCEVETSDGHYDQEKRIVRWYKNDLGVKPAFRVSVRFREMIPNDIIFEGDYSVTINNWTVSQLHVAPDAMVPGREMVRPANGLRLAPSQEDDKDLDWLMPTVEHRTKIQGALSISAAHLLSQHVETMSEISAAESITEVKGQESLPVAPSDHVINAIVEALTGEEVFVKQITENPGYVIDTATGSVRARYWRIWAKYYLEGTLRPINVRLIISGQGPQGQRLNSEGTLTFELSLRSYREQDDQNIACLLQSLYQKYQSLIKVAAHQGRQIEYQGQRVFAWQLEQQMEQELDQFRAMKNTAVILTGGQRPIQGYVFWPADNRNGHTPELPKSLQLRLCQQLPRLETPGVVWVDKWALLKQIEGEEQ